MAGSIAKISSLLEKVTHYDKDERYMAVLDITTELSKDISLDSMLERRICAAILERLEKDTNNDVNTLAVKALNVLVKKTSQAQVTEVCDRVAQHLLTGREDLRDVYAIGLKGIITDADATAGPAIAKAIAPRLLTGILPDSKPEVVVQCLDVSGTLFLKLGGVLEAQHKDFLERTLKHLASKVPAVRKKAVATVGALAPVLSDALLEQAINALLGGMDKKSKSGLLSEADAGTLIQTIGTVSRQVGFRLGRHLNRIVPLFLSWMGDPADESQQSDAANELRENILQAFESFLLRSPKEVTEFVQSILDTALLFLKYDPNYMVGDDEDTSLFDAAEEEEEDEEGYEDGDYGDDDDTSWKVRRACAKVIAATVTSRPQMMRELYDSVARKLVLRFLEREETVRLEIISCVVELVRSSAAGATVGSTSSLDTDQDNGIGFGFAALSITEGTDTDESMTGKPRMPAGGPTLQRNNSITTRLLDTVPLLVQASLHCLRKKDIGTVRTKTSILQLLRVLFQTLSLPSMAKDGIQALHSFVNVCIPVLIKALKDKSQAHSAMMRLEAVAALRILLIIFSVNPGELADHLPSIIPSIVEVAKDEWYRLVAEVLRVIAVLATLLHPADLHNRHTLSHAATLPADLYAKLAVQLFDATQPRLAAHDIDQEIKECAVTAAGVLVAHLGDVPAIKAAFPGVLSIFAERLRSETTRLQTLRALSYVALSPVSADLSGRLVGMLPDISAFVRQSSRTLRQQALETLQAIFVANADKVSHEVLLPILTNAALAIEDSDLQLAHQALFFTKSLMTSAAARDAESIIQDVVLPRAVQLSSSPVVQGASLSSLEDFFSVSVSVYGAAGGKFTFQSLLDAVMDSVKARTSGSATVSSGFGKQSVANAARIVSVLCVNSGSHASTVIHSLLQSGISSESAVDAALSLQCLGEIGRAVDVFSVDAKAAARLIDALASPSEDVKGAAAFALGGVCVGNMAAGLPALLSALDALVTSGDVTSAAASERAYLLLSALREILLKHAPALVKGASFEPYLDSVLPALTSSGIAGAAEEGVRNIAAECLGRAAAVKASKVIPTMLRYSASEEDNIRWTAITALRFAVASHSIDVNTALEHPGAGGASSIGALLQAVVDASLSVRLAAINTVNVIAYSAPHLLRPLLRPVKADRFVSAPAGAGTATAVVTAVAPPDYAAEGLLATLYYEMIPRAELVREVDLGPFKHKHDDGLPLRKAAFVTLDSILSSTLADKIGAEVIPVICSGLRDHDDVKMICHGLINKMAASPVWQGHLVAELSVITDALAVVLKAPDAKDAPSAEVLRSALRTIEAISRHCSDAPGVKRFSEVVDICTRDAAIGPVFAQVRADAASR